MSEPISGGAASAVAVAVAQVSPPWVMTALAWSDANFPRILMLLSILYTGAALYLALRKIAKGGRNE